MGEAPGRPQAPRPDRRGRYALGVVRSARRRSGKYSRGKRSSDAARRARTAERQIASPLVRQEGAHEPPEGDQREGGRKERIGKRRFVTSGRVAAAATVGVLAVAAATFYYGELGGILRERVTIENTHIHPYLEAPTRSQPTPQAGVAIQTMVMNRYRRDLSRVTAYIDLDPPASSQKVQVQVPPAEMTAFPYERDGKPIFNTAARISKGEGRQYRAIVYSDVLKYYAREKNTSGKFTIETSDGKQWETRFKIGPMPQVIAMRTTGNRDRGRLVASFRCGGCEDSKVVTHSTAWGGD